MSYSDYSVSDKIQNFNTKEKELYIVIKNVEMIISFEKDNDLYKGFWKIISYLFYSK